MSAENTEYSTGITLKIRGERDAPTQVEVSLCLADYDYLNKYALEMDRMPLVTLADRDAYRAYGLARSGLLAIARMGVTRIDDDLTAPDETFGAPLAVKAQKYKERADEMPDPDTSSFGFTIGIYPSAEDIELLGAEPDTITIIDTLVEPQGLAF